MGKLDHDFYDQFHAYYDHLNDGRQEEQDYYRRLLSSWDRVLEVACGSGSLTVTLADHCHEIVGIDLSEPMLCEARRRLPEASFLCADMRSFDLGRRFDKVICPFNSLMHMHSDADALAALDRLRAHCAERGEVIVDLFDIAPQFMSPRTENTEVFDITDPATGRHLKGYEDSDFDAGTGTLTVTIRVIDTDRDKEVGRSSFSMRFYDRAHLTDLFHRAGLTPVRVADSYGQDPAQPGARQIYHAIPARN